MLVDKETELEVIQDLYTSVNGRNTKDVAQLQKSLGVVVRFYVLPYNFPYPITVDREIFTIKNILPVAWVAKLFLAIPKM